MLVLISRGVHVINVVRVVILQSSALKKELINVPVLIVAKLGILDLVSNQHRECKDSLKCSVLVFFYYSNYSYFLFLV